VRFPVNDLISLLVGVLVVLLLVWLVLRLAGAL
jgi:hypothetical protein